MPAKPAGGRFFAQFIRMANTQKDTHTDTQTTERAIYAAVGRINAMHAMRLKVGQYCKFRWVQSVTLRQFAKFRCNSLNSC